jgi:hypothetical protein
MIPVDASPLAPAALLLRDHANGVLNGQAFTRRSIWKFRRL